MDRTSLCKVSEGDIGYCEDSRGSRAYRLFVPFSPLPQYGCECILIGVTASTDNARQDGLHQMRDNIILQHRINLGGSIRPAQILDMTKQPLEGNSRFGACKDRLQGRAQLLDGLFVVILCPRVYIRLLTQVLDDESFGTELGLEDVLGAAPSPKSGHGRLSRGGRLELLGAELRGLSGRVIRSSSASRRGRRIGRGRHEAGQVGRLRTTQDAGSVGVPSVVNTNGGYLASLWTSAGTAVMQWGMTDMADGVSRTRAPLASAWMLREKQNAQSHDLMKSGCWVGGW